MHLWAPAASGALGSALPHVMQEHRMHPKSLSSAFSLPKVLPVDHGSITWELVRNAGSHPSHLLNPSYI